MGKKELAWDWEREDTAMEQVFPTSRAPSYLSVIP